MRFLFLASIVALLPLAIAQDQPAEELKHLLATGPDHGARLSALSIQRGADYPSIIELRGKAEVRAGCMLLTADEVDYHESSGEIEPRGHVRVKLGRF